MGNKKKSTHYVDNVEFNKLLKSYFETQDKKVYERLGKIFLSIAENLLNRPNFINYSIDRKGDMISDATFYMVKYMRSYNTKRENPFAFFSQIAYNAFIQNINKVNKRKEMFVSISYIENLSKGDEKGNEYE